MHEKLFCYDLFIELMTLYNIISYYSNHSNITRIISENKTAVSELMWTVFNN